MPWARKAMVAAQGTSNTGEHMVRRILLLSACAGAAFLTTPAAHADVPGPGTPTQTSVLTADPLSGLLNGVLGGLLSLGGTR